MKCVRELKRNLQELKRNGRITLVEVVSIVVKLRQLLELKRKYQNEFPIVNLYCNWVVHTELKRSNTIYKFLLEISKAISNAIHLSDGKGAKESTEMFTSKAGNILQIPELRKGVREILVREGIDSYLCDNKVWWEGFVTLLLKELTEKPLAFPDEVINGTKYVKKATEVFEEIKSLPHANDWDKVYSVELVDKENEYHIEFNTIGNVKYVGKLLGKEPDEAYVS